MSEEVFIVLTGIGLMAFIVLISVVIATADLRSDNKLIDEWYTNGPYRAKWTESGILVFDTGLGLPSSPTFGAEVHEAKLSAARKNKTLSRATERAELYKQKAGQEIQ